MENNNNKRKFKPFPLDSPPRKRLELTTDQLRDVLQPGPQATYEKYQEHKQVGVRKKADKQAARETKESAEREKHEPTAEQEQDPVRQEIYKKYAHFKAAEEQNKKLKTFWGLELGAYDRKKALGLTEEELKM